MKLFFTKILPILSLGLAAGFLNGLLGAGGGILIVWGIKRLLGAKGDYHTALSAAIAVMLPLSLFTLFRYRAHGTLDVPILLPLLFPAILGGAAGALLQKRLSSVFLSKIFAGAVLASGVLLVI